MAFINVTDVNAWLESTKLRVISPLDATIETYQVQKVLGVLAKRYDVSTWIDEPSTPVLVKSLISMLYAATVYRRQYSEDLGSDPAYPVWLEQTAWETIELISTGAMDIPGVIIEVDTGLNSPVFYPNDAADVDDPRAFAILTVF